MGTTRFVYERVSSTILYYNYIVFFNRRFIPQFPFPHPLLHHQIRQIGAHLPLLRGGVLLQVVGHGDVKQGIVLCLLPPSFAGSEVGEGDDLAAEEDFHAVVELVESAGSVSEQQMCLMYDNFDAKLAKYFSKKPALLWIGGHIWRNWRIYLTC